MGGAASLAVGNGHSKNILVNVCGEAEYAQARSGKRPAAPSSFPVLDPREDTVGSSAGNSSDFFCPEVIKKHARLLSCMLGSLLRT